MIYLDNQATTPCDPRVVDAMMPFFTERFGNPHSDHALGRDADQAVEQAREDVAALIGADAREIVFTSGATEANNLAIKGTARYAKAEGSERRRIITCATEHKCVLESVADLEAEGFEPVILPVRPDGIVSPDTLREALRVPTLLVSVMAVNNETGVIQDIAELAALAREAGAVFHSDCAQAAGKIPLRAAETGLDLVSLSGHKIYGPKGVGALRVRRRPRLRLDPLFSGGGQERGMRSGTLAPPLLVGFGEACRIAAAEMASETTRLHALRDRLLHGLRARVPDFAINGSMQHRIAGNLNMILPRDAVEVMRACPELCVSTGSACSSAAVAPSYVLRAMGLPDSLARRSLRLAIGRFTSAADIDAAIAALADACATHLAA